ncbi:hypothetical protein N7450_000175 [Penicillium hetheringtonii]|uniref:Shikimate dehydrogenase substrate binding N-terminal domain-containing protein n=1 Tax=Penicillium hetheringtonii TaxID=911720 RepID=A0AAD6E1N5_9EURO|nr:hypothetical protein N7450_000175 [Penicillium hetheringtonii]
MHNYIAKSLGLPWKFYATECPTTEELVNLARDSSTAGLVVTMPYKGSIMEHLDERDQLENEKTRPTQLSPAPALIIGAGGASRAAVYALNEHLHSSTIYVLNRDAQEVESLIHDSTKLPHPPKIIHVKTVDQAEGLSSPYYIVGTVPDIEPKTESELEVASIMKHFLSRAQKGVLLDMCFKPRRTRMIKLAEQLGWPCVEGTHVIGYQIEEQWKLWAGEALVQKLDREGAWDVLLKAAEESTGINF